MADSIDAHEHAWSVGVPRLRAADSSSSVLAGGAAAAFLLALDGEPESDFAWSAEIDARVAQISEDELLIDAVRVQQMVDGSDLTAIDPSPRRPGLARLLLRARCLQSIEALASGRVEGGADPVWSELEPGALAAFLDVPLLRGMRRRAARLGGAAWGEVESELPGWITRALDASHLSSGLASFCSEWIIAQARAIDSSTKARGALDGMRAAVRRLERANAPGLVLDRRWAAREIDRLDQEAEAIWTTEDTLEI